VSPSHLIASLGLVGLIAIIFAETGLLVGFFLPGDSLLVTAGVLASPGRHVVGHTNVHLPLAGVIAGCFAAAAVGAQVGYILGRSAGPAIFNRPRSRLFKPENVEKAEEYFDRYGNVAIVLARFIPVVRTFANPVAGAGRMDARVFAAFNVVGALLWTVGVTLLGYFIGDSVKDTYLIPAVVLVSLVPLGIEVARQRRGGRAQSATTRAVGPADGRE
jgi:membrane-associated protein